MITGEKLKIKAPSNEAGKISSHIKIKSLYITKVVAPPLCIIPDKAGIALS